MPAHPRPRLDSSSGLVLAIRPVLHCAHVAYTRTHVLGLPESFATVGIGIWELKSSSSREFWEGSGWFRLSYLSLFKHLQQLLRRHCPILPRSKLRERSFSARSQLRPLILSRVANPVLCTLDNTRYDSYVSMPCPTCFQCIEVIKYSLEAVAIWPPLITIFRYSKGKTPPFLCGTEETCILYICISLAWQFPMSCSSF